MRRFFYTAPSYRGMGSDTDTFYLTEAQMASIIRREIERKAKGRDFDERLISKDDKPGDEARVIARMLGQKRTYAPWNDLIAILDGVQPKTTRRVFERKIFLTDGEYFYDFEACIGRLELSIHVLDAPGAFKERGICAFAGIRAENVLYRTWDSAEDLRGYIARQRKDGYGCEALDVLEKKLARPVDAKAPDKSLFVDARYRGDLDEYLDEARDYAGKFLRMPRRITDECMAMTHGNDIYFHPDEMFEGGAGIEVWPIGVISDDERTALRNALGYAFHA